MRQWLIPPTAVGGLFKSDLLAAILDDKDAPRMNLNNTTLLDARRVKFFCHLACRLDMNDPPTAVGGIRIIQQAE